MNVSLFCPTCQKDARRVYVGVMVTTVHQLECTVCRDRHTFVVIPDELAGGLAVYTIFKESKS